MAKMMGSKNGLRAIAGALALSLLASCAGSPLGDNVQQSLEADPQLEETSPFEPGAASEAADETATDEAESPSRADDETQTATDASGNRRFLDSTPASTEESEGTSTAAMREADSTENLDGIPADLQSYIRDLRALDVLALSKAANTGTDTSGAQAQSAFDQTITRREFARWLFESYNTIYADEPGERLRKGSPSDEPAFQDVSPANPDFEVIQGLAEAGIIPSAFTGNSTAVNFRPDAPLVREDLILWKVPLDTRSALPTATPQAVTATWGFQDTEKIEPMALRAIAADYQLGDFSNFRRAFGYTTLFRPDKAVTRAEAAATLWRFGNQTEGRTAAEVTAENPAGTN